MLEDSIAASVIALCLNAIVLGFAGVRLTRDADEIASRRLLGAAMAGAILLGATTSLPGLITTIVSAQPQAVPGSP
jgi:cation:H+ antiporter